MNARVTTLLICAGLTGCATPPRAMTTALTVDGDYRAVAACLHARIREVAPWHLFQAEDGDKLAVRLGTVGTDPSRIEFAPTGDGQTSARFYLPHPESYVIQLLACEQGS